MGDEQGKTGIGRIIAKALADAAFKAQLEADPVATLRAEGVAVPDGVTVKVVEDTRSLAHLILPCPPPEGEIAEAQLAALAAGGMFDYAALPPEIETSGSYRGPSGGGLPKNGLGSGPPPSPLPPEIKSF